MIKLKILLNEDISSIIENVKYDLYEWEGYTSWKEFVDNQQNGDCQFIVSSIIRKFPMFRKHFGHILLDIPIFSPEMGVDTDRVTHHWVSLNGIPYEFSKGTLKNYIKFNDLYDVEVEDISIYENL